MKTHKVRLFVSSILVAAGCNLEPVDLGNESNPNLAPGAPQPPEPAHLSRAEIDAFLLSVPPAQDANVWAGASDNLLWSALAHSRSVINAKIDPVAQPHIDAMVAQGRVIPLDRYPELQRADFEIGDFQTLRELRQLPGVQDMEPSAYPEPGSEFRASVGLGCNPTPDAIDPTDVSWISPGSQLPWNYNWHQIPLAWELTDGSDVTIGVVDTGSSNQQPMFLPENWSSGLSPNRTFERKGTYVDSVWPWAKRTDGPHDRCGHGSYMSSVLAAPRTDRNMPVGVAYGANLVVYRGTRDVFLDNYHEKRGVARALIELADRSDVKVISMSIGYIFHVGVIADAVRYAHSKGKLIVSAAGTSSIATNGIGVVFPAVMHETVAVTGLLDVDWIQACVECHYGPAVDFSMVVQRTVDPHRRSVAIGHKADERAYVGGSSAAAAMVSGIAALVWSRHPDWTREQVLTRLQESSDLYPTRDSNYGYGRISALAAVR